MLDIEVIREPFIREDIREALSGCLEKLQGSTFQAWQEVQSNAINQAMQNIQEMIKCNSSQPALALQRIQNIQSNTAKQAMQNIQEIIKRNSSQQVILEKWKNELGSTPVWLEKIKKTEVIPQSEPPKATVKLIREDDYEGLTRARAKLQASKRTENKEREFISIVEHYLASGLSKAEFSRRYYMKYHRTEATLRKLLQGCEKRYNILKNK